MQTFCPNTERSFEQGFEFYTLRNEALELTVVPALGARIISLKNLLTGREWMWHPPGKLRLFHNSLGDDFATSTLVGADECLPTIAPCSWRGRNLPDHGEVWSATWRVEPHSWEIGKLGTSVRLQTSPFDFERTIELRGGEVRLNYLLLNRSAVAESYLWALHPLLAFQRGDRLEAPALTRGLLGQEPWIDLLGLGMPEPYCAKLFATSLPEGRAGVLNGSTGDRLSFHWQASENDTLGLWLTRGGWHGYHHFAVEPTNGAPDALAVAAERQQCGTVSAHGFKSWSVSIHLEPTLKPAN